MKAQFLDNFFFNSLDPVIVNDIISTSPIRNDLNSYKWSEYLKFYLILTYGNGKIPFIPEDILYTSRYYWLKMFYHFHCIHLGTDAGIEQQIGQLIEEISSNLNNYDWSILEKISNDIELIT